VPSPFNKRVTAQKVEKGGVGGPDKETWTPRGPKKKGAWGRSKNGESKTCGDKEEGKDQPKGLRIIMKVPPMSAWGGSKWEKGCVKWTGG